MAARKAVPKKAIAKMRDERIQVPIATRVQDKLHDSRIPFGELRNVIADTLERTFLYRADGGHYARANAEAEAEIIARSIMYDDGGFRIRDEDMEIPYCREHR